MKILHVSRTMGLGGAEKIVYQLCKDNVGFTQYVASSGGVYVHELESYGVQHYLIPDIDRKYPLLILKTYFQLTSIIKKEKIDIIHTHHRMAAFYARILQCFNYTLKHVYTAHNVFYGKKHLLRFILKKSTIVAVGEGVKNNLIMEYGISPNRIKVIYNTIDVGTKVNYKNPVIQKLKDGKAFVIGNIGRLSTQKGIDVFIKAIKIAKVECEELKAVIVGDGELRADLQELVKSMELSDCIYFLGYQNHVLDIINQLEFVVLSSRWEGLPLTPIEAFSQGKTVIATNISGNNEIIINAENGLLFEKDNCKELARCISKLYTNSQLKEKLENNLKDNYLKKYSYQAFIKAYSQIYK